jgi:hypothetical protein
MTDFGVADSHHAAYAVPHSSQKQNQCLSKTPPSINHTLSNCPPERSAAIPLHSSSLFGAESKDPRDLSFTRVCQGVLSSTSALCDALTQRKCGTHQVDVSALLNMTGFRALSLHITQSFLIGLSERPVPQRVSTSEQKIQKELRPESENFGPGWREEKYMNRFKVLLLTTALITGSSALASAETFNHNGVRYEQHNRDNGRNVYGYGDHDRDDGYRQVYVDRDRRYVDRDRDRDDNWRWNRTRVFDRDHDGDRR